jgi:hypothetical protein
MHCREDLSIDAALESFVAQAHSVEEDFFIEPAPQPVIEDLTEIVEPYVEEEDAYKTLPQEMIAACIPQRRLVVSMMVSAAVSALAVVLLVRPSPPAALARPPKIEVSLPRAQPLPPPPAPTVTPLAPAPAPVVTQLAAAPAPRSAPVARSHPHKKRTLTARVSRREWSNGFAD